MADISVIASRTTLSTPVTAQNAPTIQVAAVAAQAPLTPITAAIERKTVSVAVVAAGSGGFGTSFTHAQTTPLSEWSVSHTLGVRPASILVEVGGVPIIPDVLELSDVRIVLAFGEAVTGLVTLLKGT